MKKKSFVGLIILVVLMAGTYLYNYYIIDYPVQKELNSDQRNSGININVHYENYVNRNTLIFNLKELPGDKSKIDVFRVLLQSAEALKENKFEFVKLAFRGTNKFELTGSYFRQLGDEYKYQNVMYTIRTFSDNLLNPSGERAYPIRYNSGLFGNLISGMDNFTDFSNKWYLDSYAESKK